MTARPAIGFPWFDHRTQQVVQQHESVVHRYRARGYPDDVIPELTGIPAEHVQVVPKTPPATLKGR
ncbi:MAG: hypothetical protein FJ271_27470 [Planctomycetes bacterium]|nr:hypothetical protein [Planctomycetota bacterium]